MKNNMNTNINTKLTLSLTAISLMLAYSAPSAHARGARFDFAPNIYPMEQARIPEVSCHPEAHSVRSGHVPSSKDILGIDPGSLPAAPVQAPTSVAQTQARLSTTPPAHYQDSFGSPNNAPALAALPKTLAPLTAVPKAGEKPYSANKAVSAKLMHSKDNRYIGQKVAGRLLKRNHTAGQYGQTLALKPASYGNNFGYEPGPMVPMSSGDGMTVKQNVTGTILHRK